MVAESSPESGDRVSTMVMLKYLFSQVIEINITLHSNVAFAPRLQAYEGASTEAEWLEGVCTSGYCVCVNHY